MADQGSQGRLSPWLRRKRIEQVRGRLVGRVLDFGCGGGEVAELVPPASYVGYDIDPVVVAEAQRVRPQHTFVSVEPSPSADFDTVTCLAVIEHVHEPVDFLRRLGGHLSPDGRLLVTTPHPTFEIAHTLGARLGIFSREAHDEHEDLLDEAALRQVSGAAGLRVISYDRFLAGANQLVVLAHGR